jgi:hypothetical protein
MTNDNILYQIKSYLKTYNHSILSPIEVAEKDSSLVKYYEIHFHYLRTPVEIRVYNPSFIKFKINNQSTEICCCMPCVRRAIDNLQKLKFQYDQY